MKKIIFEKGQRVTVENYPKNGYILKRFFMDGYCELWVYKIVDHIWDEVALINKTERIASHREPTVWALTEEEVQRMVLPRII